MGSISKAKKKKKTKNRKRMGKLGNITRSSEDNLEVSLYQIIFIMCAFFLVITHRNIFFNFYDAIGVFL